MRGLGQRWDSPCVDMVRPSMLRPTALCNRQCRHGCICGYILQRAHHDNTIPLVAWRLRLARAMAWQNGELLSDLCDPSEGAPCLVRSRNVLHDLAVAAVAHSETQPRTPQLPRGKSPSRSASCQLRVELAQPQRVWHLPRSKGSSSLWV